MLPGEDSQTQLGTHAITLDALPPMPEGTVDVIESRLFQRAKTIIRIECMFN